jgi:hypothetical protein
MNCQLPGVTALCVVVGIAEVEPPGAGSAAGFPPQPQKRTTHKRMRMISKRAMEILLSPFKRMEIAKHAMKTRIATYLLELLPGISSFCVKDA